MNDRPGRNDPCPCGSRKKYKNCCLDREIDQREIDAGDDEQFAAGRRQTRRGHEFAASSNTFHGLTPDQLHRLVEDPLGSPDLIRLPDPLDGEPWAPVLFMLEFVEGALGNKGVKATATGKLPRRVCQDAARALWGEDVYFHRTQFKQVCQETDLDELHRFRLQAEAAGLISNERGRLVLSADYHRRNAAGGLAALYPPLLKAAATSCDWEGGDGSVANLPQIQHAWAFTLFLLSRYGNRPLSNVFYEDCYLRLFPMEVHGNPVSDFFTPEMTVRAYYTHRSFENFAAPMGLAELKPYVGEDEPRAFFVIRKTPLLDHAVQFVNLGGAPLRPS